MKLIFLGDSLTQGVYGGDFVAEIDALRPDDTVINAGVSGSTVVNLLSRLESVIDQEPDGVFMMVGGNDSISHSQPDTRSYYKKVQNISEGFVSPGRFEETYREILYQLQSHFIQMWVGLPPKEYSPETVASQQEYNAIAASVAASFNVPVLDLMAHFLPEEVSERPPMDIGLITVIGQRSAQGWDDYENERQRNGFTYSFDGIHITPQTAKEFARLINDFINTEA